MMMCLGYLETGWKACAGGQLGEEAQSEDGGGLLQYIYRADCCLSRWMEETRRDMARVDRGLIHQKGESVRES